MFLRYLEDLWISYHGALPKSPLKHLREKARQLISFVAGRPIRFSWVISKQLAWSSMIYSHREVNWLKKQGISAILSLTLNPIPKEALIKHSIKYMHEPLPDHEAPSVMQVERCLEFIDSCLREQHAVLVHCAVGKGRSGTIIAAYLVKFRGLSDKKALSIIRRIRPGSVEREQETFLSRLYYMWHENSMNSYEPGHS